MPKKFAFVQYYDSMKIPDGVYNGLYNKEPATIRVKEGKPDFVQFINSSIFSQKGILFSSVEILLPAQQIP